MTDWEIIKTEDIPQIETYQSMFEIPCKNWVINLPPKKVLYVGTYACHTMLTWYSPLYGYSVFVYNMANYLKQ